jgi:hypothetical protein
VISFNGRKLSINGTTHELEYPIAKAIQKEGQIFVLYDPDSFTAKTGQFRNVIAIGLDGTIHWRAELPTTTTGDRYYRIALNGSLQAASIFSEVCELNMATGQILRRELVK